MFFGSFVKGPWQERQNSGDFGVVRNRPLGWYKGCYNNSFPETLRVMKNYPEGNGLDRNYPRGESGLDTPRYVRYCMTHDEREEHASGPKHHTCYEGDYYDG